jgi:tetratricopeptide (TPR) repeat protein
MNKIKNFFLKKYAQTVLASLVIFIAVWVVYANSIGNEFLWDDDAGIINNIYVHDWKYFLNFFSKSLYGGLGIVCAYWRPAVLSVFAVEWHTFLVWPGGYHIVNILLHGINALLIFYLFRLLFGRFWPAFGAALVFGVHPLNIEAVTYISGIADPLSALFILLGVIAYAKTEKETEYRRKRAFYLSVFLCFILALLSRESAVMMPGLLFLADIFNKRDKISNWRDIKNPLKKISFFLFVDAVYIVLRLTVMDFMKGIPVPSLNFPLYERILTFFHAFGIYIQLMFSPLHLHMEWVLPTAKTFMNPPVALGGFLIVIFIFLIFKTFRKLPEVSFGLAWFLIALSPYMNIFMPAVALLSEHWLYLSLPGFFFALFVFIDRISFPRFVRFFVLFSIIAWIFWVGNLTILRNRNWANPMVLFIDTLREAPKSYRANLNLGLAYQNDKQYDKALEYFERAMKIEPKNPFTYYDRALLYKIMGKEKEAMRDHEYSFSLDANNTRSTAFLLNYYSSKKEYSKIRVMLEHMLEITVKPVEREKILLRLISIANTEKNEASAKKYNEMLIDVRKEIQNDPIVKIGNFLNKYLGEIE